MAQLSEHAPRDTTLWLIGGFKLVKGLLLARVALGALRLLHHDVATVIAAWVAHLHVDPESRVVHRVLGVLLAGDDHRLRAISAAVFAYAALLLIEGVGLLLRQRWAEYFTAIITSSFLPLELYELTRRVSVTRVVVIALNAAIVWHLVRRLTSRRHE